MVCWCELFLVYLLVGVGCLMVCCLVYGLVLLIAAVWVVGVLFANLLVGLGFC